MAFARASGSVELDPAAGWIEHRRGSGRYGGCEGQPNFREAARNAVPGVSSGGAVGADRRNLRLARPDLRNKYFAGSKKTWRVAEGPNQGGPGVGPRGDGALPLGSAPAGLYPCQFAAADRKRIGPARGGRRISRLDAALFGPRVVRKQARRDSPGSCGCDRSKTRF